MATTPGVYAGREVLEDFHIKTDEITGDVFIYRDGHYCTGILAKNLILKEVTRALGDRYTNNNCSNAMAYIKNNSLGNISYSNDLISTEKCYVSVGNSRTVIGHHPNVMIRNKIPVIYDANADYSEWSKYVLDLVVEQRFADTLQEYTGYVFEKSQVAKKFLYTWGDPNSGKTTFYEIIINFFGKENVSNLTLVQLCKTFLTHNLRFKVANVRADIDYKLRPKTLNLLKSLTGDDTLDVDIKFRPEAVQMKNHAKIFLSGNGIPALPLHVDDSFFERWLPISFPKVFPVNKTFKNQFVNKRSFSAIFNWALDGLDRLRNNDWVFSYNPDVEDIKEWFRGGLINTPVERYLMARCAGWKTHHVLKDDLLEDYLEWCKEIGEVPLHRDVFHKQVKNNRHYKVELFKPVVDSKQKDAWKGLSLLPKEMK